jgi:hypothetical protein
MAILKKQSLIDAYQHRTKQVDIEALDGTVNIRSITCRERERLGAMMSKIGGKGEIVVDLQGFSRMQIELVAASVLDDNNEPMFNVNELYEMPATFTDVIQQLYEAAEEVNAITAIGERAVEKN